MDIGTFIVQRAIIHQIPQARMDQKVEVSPVLADVESALDTRRKTYFQRRIRRSMQNAFGADRDPDGSSPVPALVVDYFNRDGNQFVEMSKDIARHLHASQGGTSSSGLIAIVEGTIGSGRAMGRCLVILKLEMEEGVRVELVGPEGKRHFQIELEEVTLTESTRVFKACLFPATTALGTLTAVVSDDQLDSSTAGREIADYFLGRFLGCKMAETAQIATKRYAEAAAQYFNEIEDDETKMRYEVALTADLQSQEPTVNPEDFARRHLDEEDRDSFVARFRKEDGTVRLIPKDVSLVRNRIQRSFVELTNGVRVSGPPQEVEQIVAAIRTATTENGARLVDATIKKMR